MRSAVSLTIENLNARENKLRKKIDDVDDHLLVVKQQPLNRTAMSEKCIEECS